MIGDLFREGKLVWINVFFFFKFCINVCMQKKNSIGAIKKLLFLFKSL